MFLKSFSLSLICYEFQQKCSTSAKTSRNCYIFANSRWAVLNSLLLAEDGYLDISQQLYNTLQEFPRGYLIAFEHFLVAFLYPFSCALRLSVVFKSISQRGISKNVTISIPFL